MIRLLSLSKGALRSSAAPFISRPLRFSKHATLPNVSTSGRWYARIVDNSPNTGEPESKSSSQNDISHATKPINLAEFTVEIPASDGQSEPTLVPLAEFLEKIGLDIKDMPWENLEAEAITKPGSNTKIIRLPGPLPNWPPKKKREPSHPDQLVITVLSPAYLGNPEESGTVCVFLPGVMEEITSEPSFPRPLLHDPAKHVFYTAPSNFPEGGLGLFSREEHSLGDLIFDERPLLILPPSAPNDQEFWDTVVEEMPPRLRNRFFELHNSLGDAHSRELGIAITNLTVIYDIPGCDDTHGAVGQYVSRINHSCTPNAAVRFDAPSLSLQVRALAPIKPNEEITIAYCNDIYLSRAARRRFLQDSYKFMCQCPSCSLPMVQSQKDDAGRASVGPSLEQLKGAFEDTLGEDDEADRYLIEKAKGVVDLIENELNAREVNRLLAGMDIVCLAYLALGDAENGRKWAARCAKVKLLQSGVEGDFGDWVKDPTISPYWRARVKETTDN